MQLFNIFTLLITIALVLGLNGRQCRCLQGDVCWPSLDAWSRLNATVHGSLIKTVPIGSPCHDPYYNSQACNTLKREWLSTELHSDDSASIMQLFFANKSCDPFTPRTQPCKMGNYVSYSVNVHESEDVAAAVKFAKSQNIRFVVRNTGHDVMGRSTGASALSVWLHHLRSINIIEKFVSVEYSGPAVEIGAGVTGADLAEALRDKNLAAVTGECPSVGAAGGFLQGGGHSTLSTSFGLAADQTLAFEVVTSDGEIIRATPTQNSELYWALSGGGGGTYGVVTKVILRAHPVEKIGGGAITFFANQTSPQKYQELLIMLHAEMPGMIDAGATFVYTVDKHRFAISPITAVNATAEFIQNTVAAPFLNLLKEAKITATTQFTTLSYRDHLDTYLGPLPWGTIATPGFQVGGRMIGRKDVKLNNSQAVGKALYSLISEGVTLVGTAGRFDAPHHVANAVYPRWREAVSHISLLTPWNTDPQAWDDMIKAQKQMTDRFIPLIKAVTPFGGHYMNEADFRQKDWKHAFFGPNYPALLKIKQKWDPDNLFYSLKTVGSDVWKVDQNGRMCKQDLGWNLIPEDNIS